MIAHSALFRTITSSPFAGMVPPDVTAPTAQLVLSDDEWRKTLSALEYRVLREGASEAAHSSPLANQSAAGTYRCRGCRASVYLSASKFDSGTGRPTFSGAIPGAVRVRRTRAFLFASRTCCHCARCDGHLGTMSADGALAGGERHTLNGAALTFDRS